MRQLEIQELEKIQGGVPFWGTVTTCTESQAFNPVTGGYDTISYRCTSTYRFWINWSPNDDCYWADAGCPAQ